MKRISEIAGFEPVGQAAPKTPQPDAIPNIGRSSLAAMGLSALGIVFGDIGTSPLYTLKTVLDLTGGTPAPGTVLGVLSLILWTLIIVVTVAMSIDNDGEGGILVGAGHAEKDAAQNKEARVAVGKQIAKPNEGVEGGEDRPMTHDRPDAKPPDSQKPKAHDWAEGLASARCAQGLDREEGNKNSDSRWQDVGFQCGGRDVESFESREDRDSGSDGAIAID